MLDNGKVWNVGSGWSQVYDPDSGTFGDARYIGWGDVFTVATFLADRRVLLTGGIFQAKASIYDLGTGTLTAVGNLINYSSSRFGSDAGFFWHSATLLPNGKILITGGTNSEDFPSFKEAQVYDPSTATFAQTGSTRSLCGGGVNTLLPGDMVLGFGCEREIAVENIQFYDPSTGLFVTGSDLPRGFAFRALAALSDGSVLISGGPNIPCCSPRPQTVALYFPPLRLISRASRTVLLAPESLASLSGARLSAASATANPSSPLTSLGGISLLIRDSAGVERLAPLSVVSPKQIDFEVPAGTAPGDATVEIVGTENRFSTTAQVRAVAPGIFASSANIAMGYAVRTEADGTQTYLPAGSPIVLDERPVSLVLFATGIRNRSSLEQVACTFGGIGVPVEYAGPDDGVPGRDVVRVRLTTALKTTDGRLLLTVDGVAANVVSVNIAESSTSRSSIRTASRASRVMSSHGADARATGSL